MFGMKAAVKTLKEAGEEITLLNIEATKYLNEIQRLRAVFRANMLRLGSTDAKIDEILNATCKE